MALSGRLLSGLPLCLAAVLLGWVAHSAPLAALLAALILIAVLVGPRLQLDVPWQVVLGALAAGLAALLTGALVPAAGGTGLHPFWAGLCCWALLVSAMRLLCAVPAGGAVWTYLLGLVAIIACGETHVGPLYPAATAAYLLLSLLALRLQDPGRPSFSQLSARRRLLSLLLPLLSAVAAWLLTAPLLPLSGLLQQRLEQWYLPGQARVGFSDSLKLGALDGMLDSDEVVLRLYGPPADYLRGIAYDRYLGGRWILDGTEQLRPIAVGKGRPEAGGPTEVRLVSGDGDRLFLPLELSALATESGTARAGALGTLRRATEERGRRLWLLPGPRRVAPLPPPTANDLQVPPALHKELSALATQWTAGANGTAEKLLRIEGRLHTGYTYSLQYRRTPGRDPVLDFLSAHPQGHCEYFASAMALLARSLGIPARVVGGYRVAERNRLGGYQVVRQRNAHAWVEAHLPDRGWVRYDPTPSSGLPQDQQHDASLPAALSDLLGSYWDTALAWMSARTPAQLYTALSAALLLWVLVRRLRAQKPREERRAGGYGAPLPGFVRLCAVLAAQGLSRPPAESLEDFARRAGERDPEAGQLIARYAELRYGGRGDEHVLSGELVRCATRVERRGGSQPN